MNSKKKSGLQKLSLILLLLSLLGHVIGQNGYDLIHEGNRNQNSNIDSAILLYKQAEIMFKANGDSMGVATALEKQIKAIRNKGNLHEALQKAFESMKIYQTLNVDSLICRSYSVIGNIYVMLSDSDKGEDYHQQAIDCAKARGNIRWAYLGFIGLGNVAYQRNEDLKAREYYLKAYEYIPRNDSNIETILAGLNINLGNIEEKLGNEEKTRNYYFSSYFIYKKLNKTEGLSISSYNLGNSYTRSRMFDSAEYYFKINLNCANQLNSLLEHFYAHKGLSDLYVLKDDYKNAYDHLLLKEQYSDSIDKLNEKIDPAKVEADFKINKSNIELEQKEKEIDEITKLKQQKDFYILFILIVVIILLLSLILILIGYVKIKSKNKLARIQNKKIDKALQEKEILLKEIHHRVKNNLQMISSLLNLQSYSVTNKEALAALNQSKSRVQAIALVHRSLYQKNTFGSVNLNNYFSDLIDAVKDILTTKIEVEFDLRCPDTEIPLDTAVPLGLILNELITNSFKHAFISIERGLISAKIEESTSQLIIIYKDNGPGFDIDQIQKNNSIGMDIIDSLVDQLNGEIHFQTNENGAIQLIIPR